MYLTLLNEKEKIAFYSLAHLLAASEDGVSSSEETVLDAATKEMGISPPSNIKNIKDACSDFETIASKRIALLELMLIALVDEDFAEEEEAVMSEIVKYFDIEVGQVERAASWAEAVLAQHRSGIRFIKQ